MYDGAEAFGIQLENLERKYRNVETLKSIFYHCGDKPIYITSYRNSESTGYTDEECEQYLLMGLEAGATLCDVMGDMYKQEKYGITYDEEAVKRQRELIDKIHSRGGEVLMSVHFYEFFDEDETMKVAHAIEDRGADIVKIVNGSYTEDQMYANINIIHRMKKRTESKFPVSCKRQILKTYKTVRTAARRMYISLRAELQTDKFKGAAQAACHQGNKR